MSGGTWDYDQFKVSDLADRIRSGDTRWGPEKPIDLALARTMVADLLDLATELVKELDWHFAGDTHIADEVAWLESARARAHDVVSAESGVMQRSRPGLHRGPMSCAAAVAWVKEAEEDGVKPGAFYVARRTVTPWEKADRG